MNKHLISLSMGVAAIAFTASAYAAGGNKTYTDQSTSSNQITINQNDDGTNTPKVTGGGSGGGNSVGSLFQPFTQSGDSNVLTVNQTGTGNSLGNQKRGQQIGSGNTADVTQAGTRVASSCSRTAATTARPDRATRCWASSAPRTAPTSSSRTAAPRAASSI